MSGVKIIASASPIATTTNDRVLVLLKTATAHGIVITKVEVTIDPQSPTTPKVAQLFFEEYGDDGTTPVTFGNVIKVNNDPEAIETTFTKGEWATDPAETADTEHYRKQITVGGTGVVTLVWNFPRGLKIDGGGVRWGVHMDQDTPSAYPKVSVVIELEE